MRFGVCVPNYGETRSVEAIRNVAKEAEELGFDSSWTTDHILLPRSSGTPYEQILDSISTLAYLAPLTSRIKLGISSLIIAMRNPVVVAKQLASIDQFSGGRLVLAIGAGWNEKEFSFLGSNFHTRGKRVDESIRLIRELWRPTKDSTSGSKKFESKALNVKFEDASFLPRPRSDSLEIWVGGTSERAMRRAATLGDAWHPNATPLDDFRKLVEKFRGVWGNAGTTKENICVRIALNVKADKQVLIGPQGDRRLVLSSSMAKNKEILSDLESMGVSGAVLVPNPDGKVSPDDQLNSIRVFASSGLLV